MKGKRALPVLLCLVLLLVGCSAADPLDAVYTKSDFLRSPPTNDKYFELFLNSFFEPRSGHVMALMKPFVYIDDRPGGTRDALHEARDHVRPEFSELAG